MSAPPSDPQVSLSTSGYEDGLGRRTLIFDRESGGMLERLHLRPELGAFEAALRERMARLAAFEDERFARVQSVERDMDGDLIVVSGFVEGTRVCDLLDAAAGLSSDEATSPSLDAALGFLLEILPALAALHSTTRFAHGAVAPGRLTLTPAGQIVVLDSLFGQALERLHFNSRRLWSEFQIAVPPVAGSANFGFAADISQTALTAMMIVVGRMFREDELPHGLKALVAEVVDIAQIRGSTRFASGLQAILERTLPLSTQRPYASAGEAAEDVRQLAHEIGIPRCRAALTAFVADMSREQDIGLDEDWTDAVATAPPPVPAITPRQRGTVVVPTPVVAREPQPVPAPQPPVPVPEPALVVAVEVLAVEPEPAPQLAAPPQPIPVQTVVAAEPDALLEMLALISHAPIGESLGATESVAVPEAAVESQPVAAQDYAALEAVEPEAAAVPEIAQAAPPAEPIAASAKSRHKSKRGGKRGRDKLQSAATPPPGLVVRPPFVPAPVVPPPPAEPRFDRPPEGSHGRPSEPLRQDAAPRLAQAPADTRPSVSPAGGSTAKLRVKTELPAGYTPAPARFEHRDITGVPYIHRGAPEGTSSAFPWKLAAAALAIMVVGVGAGRVYLSEHSANPPQPVKTAGAPPKAGVPAPLVFNFGSVDIVTEPAGARVLIDGRAAGETPLTIDSLTAGRHILTFVTSSGSFKKTVRIEAGKTITLDVPVYSGWVAVFAPIPLDVSENGRAIGTTEQGRLMLAPGRHQLTLSNRELGYSTVQTVEIVAGEERGVTVQPVGELSANALPWAEVWIDGQKVGETPIANLRIPLGTHEILFKHPQLGERRMTAQVTATAPLAVSADFTRPSQP